MTHRLAACSHWKTGAAAGLMVIAIAPAVAGCQGASYSVPSTFTPSACPPGWHRASDGGCLVTGTVSPGQQLPGWPQPAPGTSGVVGQ